MLIGLTGYAQSGKDTVGDYLVSQYGFKKFAFADAVRSCVYTLNPAVDVGRAPSEWPHRNVQDIVDFYGWEAAKQFDEIRRLLQVMGTEVGREIIGPNIWTDIVFQKISTSKTVITDVRFPNEAETVRIRAGVVYKVERQNHVNINLSNHPSETLDFEPDGIIQNWGSLQDLYDEVDFLIESGR